MKKVIVYIECEDCDGTGVYVGLAELKGAGRICCPGWMGHRGR